MSPPQHFHTPYQLPYKIKTVYFYTGENICFPETKVFSQSYSFHSICFPGPKGSISESHINLQASNFYWGVTKPNLLLERCTIKFLEVITGFSILLLLHTVLTDRITDLLIPVLFFARNLSIFPDLSKLFQLALYKRSCASFHPQSKPGCCHLLEKG